MESSPARQFLEALFAGKLDEQHILIWLADGKRSEWFTSIALAAEYVAANHEKDVYVGVSLSEKDWGPHQRLKPSEGRRPVGIVGLWADLDIMDGIHKKPNLPPSVEAALEILFRELPPSARVHSGGGLQIWWLFREPWMFDSEEEMNAAAGLAARWMRALRARAATRGWDLDSVGDLMRVMRVPGTMNCKSSKRRPVTLVEINERRYNPSEIEEFLDIIGTEKVQALTPVITGEKLIYDSQSNPPFQKFQDLCDLEPKFKLSWDRTRKEKEFKDQSASAYDMALADYAVQSGWPDQEIVNLLIASRRRHKDDLKLRDSYYATTIRKARAAHDTGSLLDEITKLAADVLAKTAPTQEQVAEAEREDRPVVTEDPAQKVSQLTDNLSQMLGVEIIRVTKYMSDPPEYRIHTRRNHIHLGEVGGLLDHGSIQRAIASSESVMIPYYKRNEWAKIAQALLLACIEVPAGAESTEAGAMRGWVMKYIRARGISDTIEQADETDGPFLHDGAVHVILADLRRHIKIQHGDNITAKKLGIQARACGIQPTTVACKKSTRFVWRLPDEFTPKGV